MQASQRDVLRVCIHHSAVWADTISATRGKQYQVKLQMKPTLWVLQMELCQLRKPRGLGKQQVLLPTLGEGPKPILYCFRTG